MEATLAFGLAEPTRLGASASERLLTTPFLPPSPLFQVRDASINVIMISQASSEQSICFAVRQADGARAAAVLRKR